jgi:type II secretory pathway predicted ATPase ExeA
MPRVRVHNIGPAHSILEVAEDPSIKRYQIPHRLTSVVRRLMKYFARNQCLITCVGNIGAGKSSLIKMLAYNTGMNAMFELPDEGFEDHFVKNESFSPLLATAKDMAKRIRKMLEEEKTALRNMRRESKEHIEQLEKDKENHRGYEAGDEERRRDKTRYAPSASFFY